MIRLIFKFLILTLLISCTDKSIIISENRKKVFIDIDELKINEDVSSEIFDLGSEIPNNSFTHNGYNSSHSGGHLLGPKNKLVKVWSKDIGVGTSKNNIIMPNLIAKGSVIYTMDTQNRVLALNIEDGSKLWESNVGDRKNSYSASPGGLAIKDNELYVQLGGLKIFSLNALTGSELWEASFDFPIVSGPVVNSKGVFVTLIDGTLVHLDRNNGKLQWEDKVENEKKEVVGTGSVALNSSVVVSPRLGGDITILNISDGSFLFEDNLALLSPKSAIEQISSINAHPSIVENNVYAVAQNGRLISFDLVNGFLNWELEISSSQMPWIAGDSLFIITDDAKLLCIRREDGEIRWITKLPYLVEENLLRFQKFIVHFGPIVASEKIYLVSSDNRLRVFDARNGKLIDEKRFSKSFTTPPIIINSVLFLINDNAKLYAFK